MSTIAVVTATTGRESLLRTIESVRAQTHKCHHYLFVDGPDCHLPYIENDISIIQLPVKTGANAMANGGICAAAAFLTTEDYICFVDDDNWIEQDHIESLVSAIGDSGYAYCLRKLWLPDGTFYGNDDGEALGHHGDMVDVNCYFIKRLLCCEIAPLWYKTNGCLMVGDRYVWNALTQFNVPYARTGKYTVNYTMRLDMKGYFFLKNIQKRALYGERKPWAAA